MMIVRITMSVAVCMVDLIVAHASMNVSMQSYIFAFYRKCGHIYIRMYIYIYIYIYICMYVCISYNTGKSACAPEGECVYIRQGMSACVITNMLHFLALQNLPKTYRWHLSFFI